MTEQYRGLVIYSSAFMQSDVSMLGSGMGSKEKEPGKNNAVAVALLPWCCRREGEFLKLSLKNKHSRQTGDGLSHSLVRFHSSKSLQKKIGITTKIWH